MSDDLPLEVLRQIDDAASRFERLWGSPEPISIEALLAEAPVEYRTAMLRELLALEIELRRRRGDTLVTNEFQSRFPASLDLIAELLSSSSSHSQTGDFIESGIPTSDYSRDEDQEGTNIGPYVLERELGAGGMGVVWVARQQQPVKRRVALKLIKRGMDSRDIVRRFEQERQALAVLDHPNIAKVLDAGITSDGRPFFVMELVNGLQLTRYCDEARLATTQRLEIFQQICFAVQHAHQKGIIHRDLKPANILVTLIDGKPVPKVIDFGVAKALGDGLHEDSLTTRFGAVIGTLEYMAPEQAGYAGNDIDTRADIYALGVILYELLTGLRPFDATRFHRAAVDEIIRVIREEQPFVPSKRLSTSDALPSLAAARQSDPQRLTRTLRGDLDWIAMKCLEKDRNRRYRTADQIADEVRRYLNDEPVQAGPPSQLYLLHKFVRRHRSQVLGAGLLLLSVVLGLIVSLWQLRRATHAERAAVKAEGMAREEAQAAIAAEEDALLALANSKVHEARGARRSQRIGGRAIAIERLTEARDLFRDLEQRKVAIPENAWQEVKSELGSAWLLSEVETAAGPEVLRPGQTSHAIMDFSHHRFVEFTGFDGQVTLRSWPDGEVTAEISTQISIVNFAEFSDDGNWLYIVGFGPRLEIWNCQGLKPVRSWSKDGWQVASHCRSQPYVVVTSDGKTSFIYDRATGRPVFEDLPGTPAWGNVISPDGRKVVLYRDGEMFVLEIESKQELARWSPACDSVRWSEQGDEIAVTIEGREFQLRDADTGALIHTTGKLRGGARGVIDGRQNFAVLCDWNWNAVLQDARTGRRLFSFPFRGYSGEVQMSSRGEYLDLLDQRGNMLQTVRFSRGMLTEFGWGTNGSPVISQDGTLLAAAMDGSIQLFELATGRLLAQQYLVQDADVIAFAGSDGLWVSNGWNNPNRAERWPILRERTNGSERFSFGKATAFCQAPNGAHWKTTPDLQLFAVGGNGADVHLCEPTPEGEEPIRKTLRTNQRAVRHVALSADRKFLVAGGHMKGGIGLYDLPRGTLSEMLSESGGWAEFSPNGRFVALGFHQDYGEVWSVADRRKLYSLPGATFCFSRDGEVIAVNEPGCGMVLLDVPTGNLKLRLELAESTEFIPTLFSADDSLLIAKSFEPARLLKIDLSGIKKKQQQFDRIHP